MNEIYMFRKILAEKGIELTPDEAKTVYSMGRKFIKRSRKMSMKDLWDMKNLQVDGLSQQELDEIINLYKCAKDL